MRIIVKYDGNTYESSETTIKNQTNELAEKMYNDINQYEKFKMELKDGGYVVFGKEVIKKAIFIFKD